MATRNTNMNQVAGYGDILAEGCYHFRINKVEDDGANLVHIHSVCQTEPFVGRNVRDRIEMDNSIGLSKLKSYYKACGYEPGPEGHDPENINGGEFFAVVVHNPHKGNTYANIAPWSIKSLQEGPAQQLGPKAT